jgi:hypothetical protein
LSKLSWSSSSQIFLTHPAILLLLLLRMVGWHLGERPWIHGSSSFLVPGITTTRKGAELSQSAAILKLFSYYEHWAYRYLRLLRYYLRLLVKVIGAFQMNNTQTLDEPAITHIL